MEVSDMVRLVNDAFQSIGVYNLNLYKTYDQVLTSYAFEKDLAL